LYNYEGWQTGFWFNGLFLLFAFSTINLILQTITSLPFSHTLPRLTFSYYHIHLGNSENSATKDAKKLTRHNHRQLHLRPLKKRFGSFGKAFWLFHRFTVP
jgi:hypothetical protein